MAQSYFCCCISRLTRVDFPAQCCSMMNLGDGGSTVSTLSLLIGFDFRSLPGTSTHRRGVIHPRMFSCVHINIIAFELVKRLPTARANKGSFCLGERLGVDQRFLTLDV